MVYTKAQQPQYLTELLQSKLHSRSHGETLAVQLSNNSRKIKWLIIFVADSWSTLHLVYDRICKTSVYTNIVPTLLYCSIESCMPFRFHRCLSFLSPHRLHLLSVAARRVSALFKKCLGELQEQLHNGAFTTSICRYRVQGLSGNCCIASNWLA